MVGRRWCPVGVRFIFTLFWSFSLPDRLLCLQRDLSSAVSLVDHLNDDDKSMRIDRDETSDLPSSEFIPSSKLSSLFVRSSKGSSSALRFLPPVFLPEEGAERFVPRLVVVGLSSADSSSSDIFASSAAASAAFLPRPPLFVADSGASLTSSISTNRSIDQPKISSSSEKRVLLPMSSFTSWSCSLSSWDFVVWAPLRPPRPLAFFVGDSPWFSASLSSPVSVNDKQIDQSNYLLNHVFTFLLSGFTTTFTRCFLTGRFFLTFGVFCKSQRCKTIDQISFWELPLALFSASSSWSFFGVFFACAALRPPLPPLVFFVGDWSSSSSSPVAIASEKVWRSDLSGTSALTRFMFGSFCSFFVFLTCSSAAFGFGQFHRRFPDVSFFIITSHWNTSMQKRSKCITMVKTYHFHSLILGRDPFSRQSFVFCSSWFSATGRFRRFGRWGVFVFGGVIFTSFAFAFFFVGFGFGRRFARATSWFLRLARCFHFQPFPLRQYRSLALLPSLVELWPFDPVCDRVYLDLSSSVIYRPRLLLLLLLLRQWLNQTLLPLWRVLRLWHHTRIFAFITFFSFI